MTSVQIPLSDEQHARLADLARQHGLSLEDFLKDSVSQLLKSPDQDFLEAARYVLRKNAELYRRLA